MKRSLYIFRLHIHALAKAHLGRGTIYCNLDRQQSSLQITARHKMMLTVLTSSIRLNAMPLWVKSRHCDRAPRCPLYPRKQTLMGESGNVRFVPIADIWVLVRLMLRRADFSSEMNGEEARSWLRPRWHGAARGGVMLGTSILFLAGKRVV